MTRLRVGTRGSDLARTQTRWVCDLLRNKHAAITIEEVIIKTHGDVSTTQLFTDDWPVGGFVGAIERALAERRIDFAVHSYKDLQTAQTPGLIVAAVPAREVAHDVLVTREPHRLDSLQPGLRVGTSSPRRTAQLRTLGNFDIRPIRGNVPTRIAKIETELDAVVLAAAGLKRLGIKPKNALHLPLDRFPTAPAQGALAVQARESDPDVVALLAELEDDPTRRAVEAERAFLHASGAGCHTPLGAHATVDGERITLHGQLFDDAGNNMAQATVTGDDPQQLGRVLAAQLKERLGKT